MRYEGMIYRPPSEAYSLIVQVTIGCSQNRCIFCSMFKEKRFRIRKVEEVLEDLQDARNKYRYVEKIFLADGDALICKMTDLEAILYFIKDQFPECKQVTLYGSPRSILMKQQEDLDKLRELGISIIYMGLESGNDEVLTYIKKGVTSQEMIEAAQKVKQAKIRLSVTAISGLGGRRLWKEHAKDTGLVLSQMKPDYIGLLTLMIEEDLPLADKIRSGEFELLNPYDILIETKEMLKYMEREHADIIHDIDEQQALDDALSQRIKDALTSFETEFKNMLEG